MVLGNRSKSTTSSKDGTILKHEILRNNEIRRMTLMCLLLISFFSGNICGSGDLFYKKQCRDELSTCLYYHWTHVKDVHSGIESCRHSGEKLLEIKSRKMQELVEQFVRNITVMSSFFINMQRLDADSFESVQGGDRKGYESPHPLDPNANALRLIRDFTVLEAPFSRRASFVCKYTDYSSCMDCRYHDGEYYDRIDSELTWYEARDYCVSRDGDLMDYEDYVSLSNAASSERWLSGLGERHLGNSRVKWVWSDEQDNFAQYTNWLDGSENSSYGDTRKCVTVNATRNGKWEAAECHWTDLRAVICMGDIYSKDFTSRRQWIRKQYILPLLSVSIFFALILGGSLLLKYYYSRHQAKKLSGRRRRPLPGGATSLGARNMGTTSDEGSNPESQRFVGDADTVVQVQYSEDQGEPSLHLYHKKE